MSEKRDGSIVIDTELDSSGFEKGSNKLQNSINGVTSIVNSLGENMRSVFFQGIRDLGNLRDTGRLLVPSFEELGSTLRTALKINMIQPAIAFRAFRDILGGALGIAKKFGTTIRSAAGKILSFRNAAHVTGDTVKRLTGALTSFRTLLVQKVKNAFISTMSKEIETAMRQFAKYNSEFNTAMTKIQTMGNTVAGNVATLFANLITAVEPVATKILSMINTLITTINAMVSLISGKSTYSVATAGAQDYASAADKAAKTQKKWNNELYGFDELNRQQKKEDTETDTGTNKTTPFSWTEMPLKTNLKDIDWGKLGYDLAERLADALDKIPWDKIKKVAENIGEKTAEFLNGVFSNLHLAESIGKTIGEALNTALKLALGFLRKFDFSQFGKWLGTAFNSLVDTFDFDDLAEAIKRAANGIIEALKSFFSTISEKSKDLGKGLGKVFNSIFSGIDFPSLSRMILQAIHDINQIIAGLNETIDWDKAARNLYAGINILARGMLMDKNRVLHDVWAENGREVGKLIGGFVHYLCEVINNVHWEDIGSGIARWFNNALKGIKPEDFGGIISGLINGVFRLIKGNIETFEWESLADWLSSAINHTINNIRWSEIGNTIGELFKTTLGALHRAISAVDWVGLGKGVGQFLIGIDWDGVLKNVALVIWDAAKAAIEVIVGMLTNLTPSMVLEGIARVIAVLAGALAVESLLLPLITAIGAALAKIIAVIVATIAGWPALIIAALAVGLVLLIKWLRNGGMEVVASFFEGIKEKMKNAAQWLKEHIVDPVINTVKKFFGISSPSTVFAAIGKDLIAGLYNGIKEAWQTISDFFKNALSGIQEIFTSVWDTIKDTITKTWEKASSAILKGWKELKKSLKKVEWEEVGEKLVNGIKNGVSAVWDAMANKVFGAWDKLYGNFKDVDWQNVGKKLVGDIKEGVRSVWQTVAQKIYNAWIKLKSSFNNVKWDTIGHNMVVGMMNGMSGMWNTLINKVVGYANDLISRIKSAFGISSPSKVFAEIGEYLDKGLEQGITDGQKGVLKTASNIAEAVTDGMTPDDPRVQLTIDSVTTNLQSVISGLSDIASTFKTIADTLVSVGGFQIPQIAAGTIVPYKTKVDGSGNAETVDNDSIMNMLTMLLSEMQNQTQAIRSSGEDQTGSVKVVIDGHEVFSVVVDENNKMIKQKGFSPLVSRI